MPVPSTPQDLINLIREKLFNNTSGKIDEPSIREVLEWMVKVLDAKFSLFSPELTEEQYSKWNLMLDYMVRETKGVLTTSSITPTEKGKYLLSGAGTFTNLGGLVATADKLNYAYFDGTTWRKVEVDLYKIDDSNYFKKINVIGFNDLTLQSFQNVAPNIANIYISQFPVLDEPTKLKSITIFGKGIISVYKAKTDNTNIQLLQDVDLGANVGLHTIQFENDFIVNAGERIGIGGKSSGLSEFYFRSPKQDFETWEMPYAGFGNLNVAYSYQLRTLSLLEQNELNSQIVELKPNENFATIDQTLQNNATYYGNHYQTFPTYKVVKEITFKGSGDINIYSVNEDYSGRKLEMTLNLGNSDEVHTIQTNFTLEAGKRLIFNAINGKFWFDGSESGDIKGYSSDSPSYPINLLFAYSYKVREYSANDLAQLIFSQDNVEIVEDAISTSVYKTDFTTIGEWQTDSWEVVNGVARNLQNGITKNFHLPFIYNCNKRRAKFRIKPSADTDFRIHLKANYNSESEGGSLFGLNFGTGKMQIFKVLTEHASPDITSTGVDVNNVLAEKSFNFINGREYCVELKYYKTKHTLTITDMVTAEKTELSFDGWAGGRQQQQYSFWVNSGGQVQILDFELFLVDDVENLFVGDSITEGVMVVDKKQRWWELMTPYLKGITAVSARGGHTTGDVLAKFDNELKLLKPKRIIFLIGVNNGASPESHYTDLLNLCNTNNIKPYFCYLTALSDTSSYNAMMGRILSVVPTDNIGFRFDIATTVNNDGQTINSALFYDNLHPNESGCTEMAKRLFADVDILK